MGWIYVFIAAVIEVVWVLGLKFSTVWWMWAGTVLTLVISFYLVIKACAILPTGTVYAVFTGLGAAAIAVIDFTILGEPFTLMKGLCIGLIIIGVVGIQLTTENEDRVGEH